MSQTNAAKATAAGFTGQEPDPLTGLVWSSDGTPGGRWPDPAAGRFLSEDVSVLADGPNPYRYAGNAPYDHADPSGRSAEHLEPRAGTPEGPAVTRVEVREGVWDAYDRRLAETGRRPGFAERFVTGIGRTLLPGSDPDVIYHYSDGTRYVELGGGPSSGALGGQATFIVGPVVAGARAGAAGIGREFLQEGVETGAEAAVGVPVFDPRRLFRAAADATRGGLRRLFGRSAPAAAPTPPLAEVDFEAGTFSGPARIPVDSDFVSRQGGFVRYGALDDFGRPTAVQARITPDMVGTIGPGTPANPRIQPPGFITGRRGANRARGHLLGDQLGGSGDEVRNLVTLEQNAANSPVMRDFETAIRQAVEGGQIVDYTVTPLYNFTGRIPRGVTLQARGSGGFQLNVTVLNPPGL